MRQVQKYLMSFFLAAVVVSAIIVVLFETDVLQCGVLLDDSGSGEFVVLTFMELLTLCVIPVALRLFKFKSVVESLAAPKALLRWGMLRLAMLCLPMVANTLLYYLYFNVAFGYMGIILLLCLAFVLPTARRCVTEARLCDKVEK